MSKTKVKIVMTLTEYKKLADYLDRHEVDIAGEINDFGDLKGLFISVFDIEPAT